MIYGSKIFNFCNDLYFLPSFPFTPTSPISNCWQQNICGSLCSCMTKCYICFRDLPKAEAFGRSIWPNPKRFRLWCWFKHSDKSFYYKKGFSFFLTFQKLFLIDIDYFFIKTVLKQTCQVFYILTFGLHWISKIGVQWTPDLLVMNITFQTCSSCSDNNS